MLLIFQFVQLFFLLGESVSALCVMPEARITISTFKLNKTYLLSISDLDCDNPLELKLSFIHPTDIDLAYNRLI